MKKSKALLMFLAVFALALGLLAPPAAAQMSYYDTDWPGGNILAIEARFPAPVIGMVPNMAALPGTGVPLIGDRYVVADEGEVFQCLNPVGPVWVRVALVPGALIRATAFGGVAAIVYSGEVGGVHMYGHMTTSDANAGDLFVADGLGGGAMTPWHNRSPEAAVVLLADAFAAVAGTAYYVVDGEAAAADDLRDITIPVGFPDGGLIYVRSTDPARPITLIAGGNVAAAAGIALTTNTYLGLRLNVAAWELTSELVLPALVPLGTGNDLATFFGEVLAAFAPTLAADTLTVTHVADPVGGGGVAIGLVAFGPPSTSLTTAATNGLLASDAAPPNTTRFPVNALSAANPLYYRPVGETYALTLAADMRAFGFVEGAVMLAYSADGARVLPITSMENPDVNGVQVYFLANTLIANTGADVTVALSTTARPPQTALPTITP